MRVRRGRGEEREKGMRTNVCCVPDEGVAVRVVLEGGSLELCVGVSTDGRGAVVALLDDDDINDNVKEDEELHDKMEKAELDVANLHDLDRAIVQQRLEDVGDWRRAHLVPFSPSSLLSFFLFLRWGASSAFLLSSGGESG